LTPQLELALRAMPVVVLTGARQVGKTTLAQAGQPSRIFVTLDDVGVLGQARAEPDSLLSARPLTIDEVQREPDLLLAVKRQVDRRRNAGDFLLTGSANLRLLGSVAESLAGRAVYLELAPFCPVEWVGRRDRLAPIDRLFEPEFDLRQWPKEEGDWQKWLLRGGFPSALAAESDEVRRVWFSGYVQTYLERDLRHLSAISNLPDFQRLMALAANRAARLVNQSDLARDAGLPQATAHRYLNLLETGCLITRLSPYTTNPSTGLVKARKLFWNDCALAAWLAGIKSPEALSTRLDAGFWLEQAIFQTFQTWCSLDPSSRRLYYWRDRNGREVDVILEKDGALVAFEIKTSAQVGVSDAEGIRAFSECVARRKIFRRGVVLHGGQARPLGEEIFALPWGWMVPGGDE
jgi:predicted AAA+ superfamily ATPase